MTLRPTEEQELQAQIEAAAERLFSTADIEARIAAALLAEGEFQENISSADLQVILRNIVYVMFSSQRVAGRDIDILHNVPIINVEIDQGQANVEFVVHIHKPIIVFIEFQYALINQADGDCENLCLKKGSLRITERTRRFDVKAKAAMTAMNVPKIARQEMSDLTNVIRHTLPDQLRKKGVAGEISDINLYLNDQTLFVHLKGDFFPLAGTSQQAPEN
jgi:hypothetical protein